MRLLLADPNGAASAPPPPGTGSPIPVGPANWVPLGSGQAIFYVVIMASGMLLALCLVARFLLLRWHGRMLPLTQQQQLAAEQQERRGPDGQPLTPAARAAGAGGATGLAQAAVAACPVFLYGAKAGGGGGGGAWQGGSGQGESSCVVCLEEYRIGEELRRLPGCQHAFHRTCIDAWFGRHDTCPICRGTLQPKEGPDGEEAGNGVPEALSLPEPTAADGQPMPPPPPPVTAAVGGEGPVTATQEPEEEVATQEPERASRPAV